MILCAQEWYRQGTTNSYGHVDNPPDRFRGICCYLFSAREKHSLLSPYSYTCLAFQHVNSAHRPSVLSKGREREHIPQGFHGLYSFPNQAYLIRVRRKRAERINNTGNGKKKFTIKYACSLKQWPPGSATLHRHSKPQQKGKSILK